MEAAVPAAMPYKVRAWATWGIAVLFVLYLFGFQTGYAVVNPNIQKDIGLTLTQLGAVAAAYTWSFAIFQLFGGALLDRLGARRVLLPAIAIFTAGVFFFAGASSFTAIVAAQLVLALGARVGFVGAGYVGGQWFGMAKFSFMFGLVQCFASLFSAFNQNLMVAAVRALDWRELCAWIGAVGIVVFALAVAFLRDPASPLRPGSRSAYRSCRVSSLWRSCRSPGFLMCGLLQGSAHSPSARCSRPAWCGRRS
jgi:MFS family permease